jgi:hypothetical protein
MVKNKDLEQVEQISASDLVTSSAEFANKHINKWLHIHQTKYVTLYGTLSDGHGRITAAQIYSGALREAYSTAQSIETCAINAKRAYAKMLKAQDQINKAENEWDKIQAECDLLEAEKAMEGQRLNAESLKYMLEAHTEVINKLGPSVTAQYSSFEASEKDNWMQTAKYWNDEKKSGYIKQMQSLPLDPMSKAKLGIETHNPEMTLWLKHSDPRFNSIAEGSAENLVKLIDNHANGNIEQFQNIIDEAHKKYNDSISLEKKDA